MLERHSTACSPYELFCVLTQLQYLPINNPFIVLGSYV